MAELKSEVLKKNMMKVRSFAWKSYQCQCQYRTQNHWMESPICQFCSGNILSSDIPLKKYFKVDRRRTLPSYANESLKPWGIKNINKSNGMKRKKWRSLPIPISAIWAWSRKSSHSIAQRLWIWSLTSFGRVAVSVRVSMASSKRSQLETSSWKTNAVHQSRNEGSRLRAFVYICTHRRSSRSHRRHKYIRHTQI